jgi:hypothetical protein
MHINTQGAQRRHENAPYHPLVERNVLIQKLSGLLSQDQLRRLVAAMVD